MVEVFSGVGLQQPPTTGPENPRLNEEVKLHENAREREDYDNRANVFALLQTIQALEKAYIKDAVNAADYSHWCVLLLDQFKAAFKLVKGESFTDAEMFARKYLMDCPAALERIKEDRPITEKGGNQSKSIAEIVSLCITVMDRLRLEIRAKDELQPDVKELYETMGRMRVLPPTFEGRIKVKKWLDTLNAMNAADELSPEQVRDMLFDFESGYNDFNRFLAHS